MRSLQASSIASRTAGPARGGVPVVLGAALLGFFLISLDALIVTVALPDIGRSLGGGMSGLQWVVDGYTLVFAALMLSAGAVSDRIGARRAYGGGLVLFALASAACGLAPGLGALVAARLVQGGAAALMMPASLALVRQGFPDQAKRARAIAVWTVGGAVAVAAGPVLGGALTASVGWRWIFFVNLPAGLLALALLTRVPTSPRLPARLDTAGQITAVAAMGALTYGVIEGGEKGVGRPLVVVSLLVAVVAAGLFLATQARGAHPMLPLPLFRSRVVAVSLVVGFMLNATYYGGVFVFSLYLQQQRGQSALHAGMLFIPMTALVAVVNLASAKLAARFGPRVPMVAGQLVGAAGSLALLTVSPHTHVGTVAALMVPVGLGGALAVPALTALLLDAVPADRAGTASAVLNTARQVGGAIAVAIFGALLAGADTFLSGMRWSMLLAVAGLLLTAGAAATLPRAGLRPTEP
ncbi:MULTISPECIES: MFS transporter [Streptomyces]|uniref:MFS transporter n=2 Tax=Streptomyces rimosus subsp. rimosus TaxID=132474 RepID=A0A8A1UIR4_STRR1|nr:MULTISPECIES: MFS transporter [Streptomyces]KOG69968.1 MFS transporter [Kitasatospora aureofaciens]MYT42245.1 MFS transporter [Streptomyces sp. SID5471]KOT30741.1 MFS transporter [Streptomyces sp. NRRL WC-3701]KOT55491.1 MFS transporter [Streptomyces rimosus subsp. rimosus]KOT71924.1 MFS transporter [Streptomyces rimosus subsp. rimosus]